jgi:hypothetical protein
MGVIWYGFTRHPRSQFAPPGTQPRGSLKRSATSRAEPSAFQQGRAVVLLDEVHLLLR